ncbi:hypothetical protein, partial [Aurantimonas sp. C2-4-R8]|uniref:hypothetical protein n=3 Tax=unclassified Aurantimonas TaxID=2638230 RepID=UPI002E187E1A|nr:hypothetical protein [Aurantimonas sp. C2-4-R8]
FPAVPPKGKQPIHWPGFTPARPTLSPPLRGLICHRPTHLNLGDLAAIFLFIDLDAGVSGVDFEYSLALRFLIGTAEAHNRQRFLRESG